MEPTPYDKYQINIAPFQCVRVAQALSVGHAVEGLFIPKEGSMEESNNMDIFNELIKHEPHFLDKPIEELAPISFVGQAAVAAYRSMISRLDSLPMTEEQKRKTLGDGQEAGKMLLAIEGRIGELSQAVPRAPSGRSKTDDNALPLKHERIGISEKAVKNAQTIANNPKAVEEVIREAEENDDIPTKTAVLNKVRLNKEIERRKKAETDKPIDGAIMSIEMAEYLNALEQVVLILPKQPPKDWSDDFLRKAKGYVNIIKKRLEAFDE